MESDLDQIETGQQNAASVWDGFVNSFRQLHEAAISKKKETPTKRQLDYYMRLAELVSKSELEEIIGNEEPQKMDGERIGEVIDKLKKATEDIALPASTKQISQVPLSRYEKAKAKVELYCREFAKVGEKRSLSELATGIKDYEMNIYHL